MSWNRIGRLALTNTPLFALSMERINFLECRYTKKGNNGIGIGIIVPLEEGAPVGTSLLTNHFNSTGAAVPRGTTMEVMKKKKFCSWTIDSIPFYFRLSRKDETLKMKVFATHTERVPMKPTIND